ncbi:MAG: hydroxysqualene dehydroxylase HpnE [Pseudomonadota bacterium]
MKARVAVVGGGWAGCAAALTLAEAGVHVTLIEAARTLGGRARAVELEGEALDNGQHILLGAYAQTLRLIARLQPESDALWRLPLTLEQPPDFRLACPRLPAPLHLAAGLLTARGLSGPEKWAAARWAAAQLRGASAVAGSVDELTRSQPEKLRRLLWHPLCVSALNTPPEMASAQVFRDVLRAAFGGRSAHSDLLLPRRDLSALFPAPAAARIAGLGGEVRLAQRVTVLADAGDAVRVGTREAADRYSHVVLAVAPQHLSALAAQLPELETACRAVAAYAYQPIATAYLQFEPAFRLAAPLYALGDGPAQFAFDRGQSHGQAGLVALVASAASALDDHWVDQTEAQLRRIADPGPARWRRRIVEKQATYACVPGMARPGVRTPHPRVFLAGDYTAGPYPATLESATTSGVQSAASLLESL